ncbi:unnamed protein product [Brassica rapa subsp. trilocularis]
MLCTVGWCLTAVLSIFSREVGSLEGGRLGASQVGSACCIWTYLPSGSLIGNGGRYFSTFICEGRLSFGSRKVVALASSSYTGVRVAVWLSGLFTLVGRLTRMTVQSPRLGEYRQCG